MTSKFGDIRIYQQDVVYCHGKYCNEKCSPDAQIWVTYLSGPHSGKCHFVLVNELSEKTYTLRKGKKNILIDRPYEGCIVFNPRNEQYGIVSNIKQEEIDVAVFDPPLRNYMTWRYHDCLFCQNMIKCP